MKIQRTRNDYFYYQIALQYFSAYIKIKNVFSKGYISELKEITKNLPKDKSLTYSSEEINKIIEDSGLKNAASNLFKLRTYGTTSIVFSALCLESLINDYCVTKKSQTFLQNYLDKLDPVSKWVIIPKVITGKSLDTDGTAIELLRNLFSARNDLIHPKSKFIKLEETDNLEGNRWVEVFTKFVHNSSRSILTIKEATKELHNIDNSFSYLEVYEWLWTNDTSKFKSMYDIETIFLSWFADMEDRNNNTEED